MAFTSTISHTGISNELHKMKSKVSCASCERGFDMGSGLSISSQFKKRKVSAHMDSRSSDVEEFLPVLHSSDYYMEPSVEILAEKESADPGYCSRVQDFTVGRFGYGFVKFLGETDVRWLNLDQIVKLDRHNIVVYEDEMDKPEVGEALNKPSEVVLFLQIRSHTLEADNLDNIVKRLKSSTERQGACFVSFDPIKVEWKFIVPHFSKFGLSDDDEEDIIMDDTNAVQHAGQMDDDDELTEDYEDSPIGPIGSVLSHSLPAHLGLDPIKMQDMKMVMFPMKEEDLEDFYEPYSHEKQSFRKEYVHPTVQYSTRKVSQRISPLTVRRTPQALLEYHKNGTESGPLGTILMTSQNKGMPLRTAKVDGFKLDLKYETPITKSQSSNVADASLFMGRSFRVGWGPNGVLLHTGNPVGKTDAGRGLSSVIHIEKVAVDKVVRDESGKVKKELIDFCFTSPLNLHKSIDQETTEFEVGSSKIKLRKIVSNRVMLQEICRGHIGIVEKQLDVPGLSSSAHTVLMHQVMIWELIKVLFSTREASGCLKPIDVDDEEDMMHDKDGSLDIDQEALPYVRRAEFSYWLQESVSHRVQYEISYLNDSNYLQQILLHLTGKQLGEAVELAASRGDVRLSCLLSQAGGSMVNRGDVARQLDLWRINGLDFNFIEKNRLQLYDLLAGNIQGALENSKLDWKRFLGLLMWYQLPPDTSLPNIVDTYEQLLYEDRAPYPVPIYIDEGTLEDVARWNVGDRYDLAYYLMLLHANKKKDFGLLKTMFSAFSSTYDALDYHMIWHQRAILEAVGAFSSNDLHILDMSLVSQLLCLGQYHWAIYVVLHMPYHEDYPYLQPNVIREILFRYCEFWSVQETQKKFIEDLGIPKAWLHEALAVYFHYHGDLSGALENFLECSNWQKAHSIFMTSVAHSLFLSAKHNEVWRLAISMEGHKSEIADWDLGAGIYISFYSLKSSLQEDAMGEVDSMETKNRDCRDFFGRLKESMAIWGNKLAVDARATYSKMAEKICNLLLSSGEECPIREVQLSSFDSIVKAPVPEDLRSWHLQEAVSLFTDYLSEAS
ncbi:hypothetical protein MKX01_037127 [Papaver californicum]|nr:hypothetical protein MKX01_037127 [Papaver californicum]